MHNQTVIVRKYLSYLVVFCLSVILTAFIKSSKTKAKKNQHQIIIMYFKKAKRFSFLSGIRFPFIFLYKMLQKNLSQYSEDMQTKFVHKLKMRSRNMRLTLGKQPLKSFSKKQTKSLTILGKRFIFSIVTGFQSFFIHVRRFALFGTICII